MRALFLSTHPRRSASTRWRMLAYLPAWEEAGHEAVFEPFWSEDDAALFATTGHTAEKARAVGRGAVARVRRLLSRASFDVIFVQREASPVGGAWTERALRRRFAAPLVYDVDDALWIRGGVSAQPALARLLRAPEKTYALLHRAAVVLAGSGALASTARAYARDVRVLPTVVSAATWRPASAQRSSSAPGPVRLGFIGSPSTAPHLGALLPVLRALWHEGARFSLLAVGCGNPLPPQPFDVVQVPWTEAEELAQTQSLDVGLAPMGDDAWARGMCGAKNLRYMAVGVPHVGSPVGGAAEVVEDGVTGLWARTPDDWAHALRRLVADRALREELGARARQVVEARYCVERQAAAWVRALEDAAP